MPSIRRIGRNLAFIALASFLCACGGGSGGAPPGSTALLTNTARWTNPALGLRRLSSSGKITHVVIIVQENRTVDNLFQGYPGANTQSYGYESKGKRVTLRPVPLEAPWDIQHSSPNFFKACDGQGSYPGTDCKMDGFDTERASCGKHNNEPPCPFKEPQYAYVPQTETAPYFSMAKQYVLGDDMFTSNFDGSSFVSHQYIIAAQASSTVDFPINVWGCTGGPGDTIKTITQQRQYGPPVQPCFENATLGDELDGAGLSWRYYANTYDNGWNAYQAIKHIRKGPDWHTDVIWPETRFLKDITTEPLSAVTWITPSLANSDHSGSKSKTGPDWVATVVNAIGESPNWSSTAIFVFWDDYGGWYDHAPPPLADYDGLGFRVPLLVISPYAKQGWVSHVQYEHAGILRFIEDQFGLAQLSASDARATSPAGDCFDFTQQPRTFVPLKTRLKARDFLNAPIDDRPVDDQ
jgi:phospholipase C